MADDSLRGFEVVAEQRAIAAHRVYNIRRLNFHNNLIKLQTTAQYFEAQEDFVLKYEFLKNSLIFGQHRHSYQRTNRSEQTIQVSYYPDY
jgi:hypothetical protein